MIVTGRNGGHPATVALTSFKLVIMTAGTCTFVLLKGEGVWPVGIWVYSNAALHFDEHRRWIEELLASAR